MLHYSTAGDSENKRAKVYSESNTHIYLSLASILEVKDLPPTLCHGSWVLLKPQVKQILPPLFLVGVLSHWLDK